MVRAKFRVDSVEELGWIGGKSITLSPVYDDGCEENKEFFAATPSGSIDLGVVNPAAAEQFKVGQAFYVDFTPAEE